MATLAEFVLPGESSDGGLARRARVLVGRSGAALLDAGSRVATADLAVDLGDHIGSKLWWRGLLLLGALAAAAISLGARMPAIPGAVPFGSGIGADDAAGTLSFTPLADGSSTGRRATPTALVQRLSETPERPRLELVAKVAVGGLEAALKRAGVGADDLRALRSIGLYGKGYSPAVGSKIDLVLGRRDSRAEPRPLQALAFRAAFEWKAEVSRNAAGQLTLRRIPIRIDDTPLRITGTVGASLDRSARLAGVPASIIAEYRRQLGYAVDLQHEVKRGDRFEIIIANRRAETGESQMGALMLAALHGEKDVRLMRWGKGGQFFKQNGEAALQGLIRTPVAGARQSSGFGMRFHPVLGYSRMHKGVDFAAATGSPIHAAAAGTVVSAGRAGGYGNMVEVDHGKGLHTRYAHMSRIAVKRGQKVVQGQVLGAVGSTGLATGPHLHYEIWQNGKVADPRSTKFRAGSSLGGRDLQRFKAEMARLEKLAGAPSATARG